VPRASFRIVEDKTRHLLERLRADSGCAALGEDEILVGANPAAGASGREAIRHDLIEGFATALQRHRDELTDAGPGMASAIEKARRSVEHAAERLSAKYETALRHQRQDLVDAARQ